jgi:hypothetical protein
MRGTFRYSHASLQGVIGDFLAVDLPDDCRAYCFAGRCAEQYFLALSMREKTPNKIAAHNAGGRAQFRIRGSRRWSGVAEFWR